MLKRSLRFHRPFGFGRSEPVMHDRESEMKIEGNETVQERLLKTESQKTVKIPPPVAEVAFPSTAQHSSQPLQSPPEGKGCCTYYTFISAKPK